MTDAPKDSPLSEARSTGVGSDVSRRWQREKVDPVTQQVIGGALHAIAKEMAELLYRMAYSSIMRESRDIGAGILDFHGRQICESDSTPMHCGSLPAYVRGIEAKHRGQYQPGDVLLHALPIFHVHGLFVALNVAFLNVSKIIWHDRFDVERIVADLPKASVLMGVPTFYTRLLGRPELDSELCRNMRLFVAGSAPLLAETHDAFAQRTGHGEFRAIAASFCTGWDAGCGACANPKPLPCRRFSPGRSRSALPVTPRS